MKEDYPMRPFGEADCESEVKLLGEEYRRYYFHHTQFNADALDPAVFLIVGRRGSGKTALARFFGFQQQMKNAIAIEVDEPVAYQDVLTRLSALSAHTREIAIPRLSKVWEFVIWSMVFREMKDMDPRIKDACIFEYAGGRVSAYIKALLNSLIARFSTSSTDLIDDLIEVLSEDTFQAARAAVMEIAKKHPVIIAFDTLENYAVHDEAMVRAMAALIECASRFNRDFAPKNVHIKLFVMAEVFPYLCEEAIPNTLKHVRREVYLHWRPKDLMRLISWRFHRYLQQQGTPFAAGSVSDWDNHKDVIAKMWNPYFDSKLTNGQELPEKTFPYVLRHTQLRPRQLILICNAIAQRAIDEGTAPRFTSDHIRDGVRSEERRLASEVINAYSSVYPKVSGIVDALVNMPMIFRANELHKRARSTASEWPDGDYSPRRFVQLVTELGIVGRIRSADLQSGYVEADFEYASDDRLRLMEKDECVIHPMFYAKLNTVIDKKVRVYPFPDHQEFRDLDHRGRL
jgi:hypothetical protein